MYFVGSLPIMVGVIELISGCIQFKFSREVSFFDNSQVIGTYPGSSEQGHFGVCGPRCDNDIRCNAIDICYEKFQCKLINGWTPPAPGNVSEGVCRQFQMQACPDGYFFDRKNLTCINYYYICNFESDPELTCFLSESLSDEFNWTTHKGSTSSTNTGPSSAYHGLHYKYIETSAIQLGQRAVLESSKTFQAKTYCLTMYYHMYGATINTLTIRTQKGNSAAIDRWKMSGNQGNVWHYLSGVNLPLDSQTKIIIEATKGSSHTGDTAIDYVELRPFACP
uniref:MAM domain-containing protein n=1 Tax=Magallana gigas TaxID=29159 RepID=A0A8W8LPE5_MAGGI|nr:MAM and LDL-receptor class A domain-containing protein 1-like isoform X1 [Crassostrea gigas]